MLLDKDANRIPPLPITEISGASSDSFCSTIRQLNRVISRQYDLALQPFKITAAQFILLGEIAQEDGIHAVEIGRSHDIDKSGMSRNLKRLVALGFISMDPFAGKRGRGLHLTLAGEDIIRQATATWRRTDRAVAEALGPKSKSMLDELMVSLDKLPDIV